MKSQTLTLQSNLWSQKPTHAVLKSEEFQSESLFRSRSQESELKLFRLRISGQSVSQPVGQSDRQTDLLESSSFFLDKEDVDVAVSVERKETLGFLPFLTVLQPNSHHRCLSVS